MLGSLAASIFQTAAYRGLFMLMTFRVIPTASSRPLVTWDLLTTNLLSSGVSSDVLASRSYQDGLQGPPSANMNGVTPDCLSLAMSLIRSAQVAGGPLMPALLKADLL